MIILGLTGGIGMGKSNAASMFRRLGLPVFDADAAVHKLQQRGGRAVGPIATAFPGCVRDGLVDREALRAAVIGRPGELKRLERIVHPLVRADEKRFLSVARRAGRRAVVLDIPLLFETGGEERVDAVVVVSAPAALQRQRVLLRGGMDPARFAAIVERQTPDAEKRRRADVVIHTGLSRYNTQRHIRRLVRHIHNGKLLRHRR